VAASGRSGPPSGGGITVPPLPPIPNSGSSGRRPLSNEDFEEELDIPEFLKN
jgi:cell division protein FtsZ